MIANQCFRGLSMDLTDKAFLLGERMQLKQFKQSCRFEQTHKIEFTREITP